jgi:aerobic-type carbon monoxide dehydrogenase small subunit (CoxS/CutS family)
VAEAGEPTTVRLRVNGRARAAEAEPRLLLSDFLRHRLELTGTHVGCEHGVCGACTVLIDGEPARACLTFAVQAEGSEITTIEGLAPDGGGLHPVQQAFHECHGMQCGFCTPGFVLSLVALLSERPNADDDELLDALSGNLCRCTGYRNIVDAARQARERMADG